MQQRGFEAIRTPRIPVHFIRATLAAADGEEDDARYNAEVA